jgi:hypothetical protein
MKKKRAEEANKRAEEEKKRAEEANKRADEEKRRADEETNRAAEARAREAVASRLAIQAQEQVTEVAHQNNHLINRLIWAAVVQDQLLFNYHWTAEVLNPAIEYMWGLLKELQPPQPVLAITAAPNPNVPPPPNAQAVPANDARYVRPAMESLFDTFRR